MAEQNKTTAKKAAASPAKGEKPDILTAKVETSWASSAGIAKLIGRDMRRVQQLTQEGVLETAVPPGGGARKYRTCETVQRYIAYKERRAQETGARSRTADLNLKKLEAEVRLKESQGELAAIKADIAGGRYIETAAAAQELAQFLDAFQSFARNIPSRVAGVVGGYTDAATARAIERATRKELEELLALFVSAALPDAGEEAEAG